jgi:ribonuclease HI
MKYKMSLFCDGGMNKNTGDEAWGSVVDSKGIDLIEPNLDILYDFNIRCAKLKYEYRHIISCKFSDVKYQQNNGAELLAFIAALRIAIKRGYKNIKLDSNLIYQYWSKGQVNKTTLSKMDSNKKNYIFECKELREKFESQGGLVEKIPGKNNLADLGWH